MATAGTPLLELPMLGAFTDASAVAGTRAGAGRFTAAALRDYLDPGRPTVNVREAQFGATGDGTTDDTAAIQSAIDLVVARGGGTVFLPNGTYKISQTLTVTGVNVALLGQTRFGATILGASLDTGLLRVLGDFFIMSGLGFMYAGTPAEGGNAIELSGAIYATMTDFAVRSCYTGVVIGDASATIKMSNFEVLDYIRAGVDLSGGALDTFMSDFTMNAGASDGTRGLLGGLRISGFCEAVIVENGDILLGEYSMTTDAANYVQGQRPAYNRFTNVYFDSSARGVILNRIDLCKFIGCWFAAGRDDNYPGLTMQTTKDLTFIGCDFFNCGSHGAMIETGSSQFRFLGCTFDSNSETSGVGVADGLFILGGTSNWSVQGCKFSNGLYTGQQGYGVSIGAGTSNNINITGNMMTGNATGSIRDLSSGTGRLITGNTGIVTRKSGTATVVVGQAAIGVSHGLSRQPLPQDITLTAISSPIQSGVTSWFVYNVTPTAFSIGTNAVVAAEPMAFGWQAQVSDAD